jgi:hypothetical protein
MPDDPKPNTTRIKIPKKAKRERGADLRVRGTINKRVVATDKNGREFASAGPFTVFTADGKIGDDASYRNKIRSIRDAASGLQVPNQGWGMYERAKVAGLFSDGGLGFADISDSNNIGYYSYEFPVDALELPASRAEELRFYRLAYDRDPIVGRAIDMHTELPLSKMEMAKPKCSSEEFADYVFDYYQRVVNKTKLFQILIDACREYWTIGEAYLFVEKWADENEKVEPCDEAKKVIEKDQPGDGSEPTKESEFNAPLGGTAAQVLDFLTPQKTSSWALKRGALIDELKTAGISFDFYEDGSKTEKDIKQKRTSLNRLTRLVAKDIGMPAKKLAKCIIESDSPAALFNKVAKVIGRTLHDDQYPIQVTAEMVKVAQPPAAPAAPAGGAPAADAPPPDAPPAEGEAPVMGDEGAPLGEPGLGDVAGVDPGMEGGAVPPMGGGGGGGFGGGPMTPTDLAGDTKAAIAQGASISAQRELMELKHLLELLERKKELLEELQEIREKKREEMELFSHVTNKEYDGPSRIQVLPPEQMEITPEGTMTGDPTIYFKPPEQQKQAYAEDPDVPNDVKDSIQQEGKLPLNRDPFKGSYVIHFARKKSGYELHGRSILQRCIRTIIYREKLRQVQSTLASRNMTPKTLIIAPDIPASEVMALRAHVDEAKADPDYSVVLNYECRWDEIGSEGRLLSLDAEWQHTNSDLAIGLGLSPELLIGEGMYSGNHIQLQLMETSYLQFRDLLTTVIEDLIFKPIAMEKGFYEMDKYGNPRWIYPKVTFSRMALRDQGDLYDMLFNLYAKGSLPVDLIYEFLNIDKEDAERKLEDALFTVKDSKFANVLDTIYNSAGEWLFQHTDIGKRITKALQLTETDAETEEGPEGSGEGM